MRQQRNARNRASLVCRAPHAGQAAICWTSCGRWVASLDARRSTFAAAPCRRRSPDGHEALGQPSGARAGPAAARHARASESRHHRGAPDRPRRPPRCTPSATRAAADLGAACWVLASILDHADGELARLTGKVSAFGHRYDRAADLIVKLSLFAGMGASLRHGPLRALGASAGRSRRRVAARDLPAARRDRAAPRRWRVQAARARVASRSRTSSTLIAPLTWLGWLGPVPGRRRDRDAALRALVCVATRLRLRWRRS